MVRKLTPLQTAFVNEYIIDFQGSAALSRAYDLLERPQPTSLISMASENLTKPHIVAAVSRAVERRNQRTEITADWIVKELAENIKMCKKQVPYQGGAINGALTLLAKHTGGFEAKVDADRTYNFNFTMTKREGVDYQLPDHVNVPALIEATVADDCEDVEDED